MDQIANMLVMLKNASRAEKDTIVFPYSKVKFAIANCLLESGYIAGVSKKHKKGMPVIEIVLAKDADGSQKIHDINRLSKPSCRLYTGVSEIRSYKNGYGSYVLSTPKGIMTDKVARKELVGGELLFRIW